MAVPTPRHRILTTGNQMSARAALDAGCRFFAGYPITPASEIYQVMTKRLPSYGGAALSAPDEISALAYALGASMRGARAMTATSGPGWALMVESVGYAVMTETPVVIALVQRLGPTTGAATQGAQGDIALVSQATSGGYPFPVFAPSTAAECYSETLRAFLWAEKLRTPVVVLSDKEVASTSEVVDLRELDDYEVPPRAQYTGDEPFDSYDFDQLSDVPLFAPVGGGVKVTVTGSAHNKQGLLKKADPEVIEVLNHLRAKIEEAESEVGEVDLDAAAGAKTLVLSYGVSARASRDAVALARADGRKVSFVNVRTLFPLPVTALKAALKGIERVIIPEENHGGLYRQALGETLRDYEVVGVNGIGRAIKPQEVRDAIA